MCFIYPFTQQTRTEAAECRPRGRLGDSRAGQARRPPASCQPGPALRAQEAEAGEGGKPWVTEPLKRAASARGEAQAQGNWWDIPTNTRISPRSGWQRSPGRQSPHRRPAAKTARGPQLLPASAGPELGRGWQRRIGTLRRAAGSLSPCTRIPGSWFFKARKERDRSYYGTSG